MESPSRVTPAVSTHQDCEHGEIDALSAPNIRKYPIEKRHVSRSRKRKEGEQKKNKGARITKTLVQNMVYHMDDRTRSRIGGNAKTR